MFKALCTFACGTIFCLVFASTAQASSNSLQAVMSTMADETVAYKTEFADLIGRQPKRSLQTLETVLRSYQPLIGETNLEFTNRLEIVTNLWFRHNVYVYYWSTSRQKTSAYNQHIELLQTTLYWLDAQLLPSSEHFTHIIIRNDVPATATTTAVVLPMSTNFRTLVHEYIHVLQQVDPKYKELYTFFERTFRRVQPEEFATEYHPNAQEHMAEWFIELLVPSHNTTLIERTFIQSNNNQPLMRIYLQYSLQLLADNARVMQLLEQTHALTFKGRITAPSAIEYKSMILQL